MTQSAAYKQRHEQLDNLWNIYQTAKSAYETAKNQNNVGHIYQQTNTFVFPYSGTPTDEPSFYSWLAQSDASVIQGLASMNQKKADYESYKADVTALDAAEFAAAHPEVAVNLAAVSANAGVQTALGLAQIKASEEQTAKLSQAALEEEAAKKKRNTTIIIVVVAVVVIGTGIFLFFKLRKKA